MREAGRPLPREMHDNRSPFFLFFFLRQVLNLNAGKEFLTYLIEEGNIVFQLFGSERRRASRAQETGKPVIEQSTRSRRLLA